VGSGEVLVEKFRGGQNIYGVDWSPDGKYLMAAGTFAEPVVRRARQSTAALVEYAYECCVFRELASEEHIQSGLPPR
jgi:hypothetical protein